MKKGHQREAGLLTPGEMKLSEQPGPSLPLSEAELSAAFDFFDMSGHGRITPNDLAHRLGAFYKNLPVSGLGVGIDGVRWHWVFDWLT